MTDPILGGTRPGPQALSAAISAVLAGIRERGGRRRSSLRRSPASARSSSPRPSARRASRTCPSRSPRSTRDAIAMRGLQQIDDIVKYIPGLSLAQREPGGTTIVFRGVASFRHPVRRRLVLGALPRRAADHAERAQSRPALHRHRARRGAARPAGHAVRRELAVRAHCASSPPSPTRPASTPGPRPRSPASQTATRATTSARC